MIYLNTIVSPGFSGLYLSNFIGKKYRTRKNKGYFQSLSIIQMIMKIHPYVQNSDNFNLGMFKPVKY